MNERSELVSLRTGRRYLVGGCIPSKPTTKVPKFGVSRVITDKSLPSSVDLRPNMTPVEHQDSYNSCVGNALAGAYEFLIKSKTGKHVDVSRLFIYYNGRLKDGLDAIDMADIGCSITSAIDGLKEFGCCKETLLPYKTENLNQKPPSFCYREARSYHIECGLKVETYLNEMKACLAQGYPFVFGLRVFESFSEAETNGGRVPLPRSTDSLASKHGMHAMLAAGYSDEGQYFIVRNSWGEEWGDKGYCYVPYDYMSNPDLCTDLYTIKTISSSNDHAKSNQSRKHSYTDVDTNNILSNDFPDDFDVKQFWDTAQNGNFAYSSWKSVEKQSFTWTSGQVKQTFHKSVEKSSIKSTLEQARVLWIDKKTDEILDTVKRLSHEIHVEVEFCEKFSYVESYFKENIEYFTNSSLPFQIICRGYYKYEDKNPLDLLCLLNSYNLQHIPVTVFTNDKEGLIGHLKSQAPSKGTNDWKSRLYIVRHRTDLIDNVKANIKHGTNGDR